MPNKQTNKQTNKQPNKQPTKRNFKGTFPIAQKGLEKRTEGITLRVTPKVKLLYKDLILEFSRLLHSKSDGHGEGVAFYNFAQKVKTIENEE